MGGQQAFGLEVYLRTATGADAVKASLTNGSSNSRIKYTAVAAGTSGNSIRVTVTNPGALTPLSIAVVGNDINITAEHDGSAIVSTVNDIIAEIYGSAAASALIDASNDTGDGTGLIGAMAQTSLSGGAAATHTFELINNVLDCTVPGLGRSALDLTSHSSPNGYAEYEKSIVKDGREITLSINYDPADTIHAALKAEEASDNASTFRFVFPYAGANFETSGLVLDFPISMPVRGLVRTDVKIQLTGEPTAI